MRRIALLAAICAAVLVSQAPLYGQFNASLRPREEQQVRQWYNDYLGREVGPELRAWVELLKSGMSPLDVQATILGSDEFFNQKGRDTQSFVIETLQSVTWEEPTVSELRRWTDRLTVLRGDRLALAREILIANDQAAGGTTGAGPDVAETAARLSTAAKLLVDTIDFEIGGTQQGRQANLKAQALSDSTEQLHRTVAVTSYRPTDASLAVQNVERSLTALQSTLNSPAGTAPGAAGIARRVGTMIEELEVALRPSVTQPRPRPETASAPGLGPTAEKLLVQAQSASRGVESIIQSLTGQANQNYGTSVVLRDLDTFAAALEELQTSVRRGSSRDRVQWEIESLAAQAVRIGPQLRGSQMPPFTRLFWSSVESSLEQMADTLGITGGNSTVLRPTPAEPEILPLVDQALSRAEVFLTGSQPLVFGVPEVPRVQRDVRNLKSRLLQLRQEAQQGEPAARQLETLSSMVADYQNAYNRWGQIVTARRMQNPPRLSPIGEALNEVERLLKLAASGEDVSPNGGSVSSSRAARLLETLGGQVQQYRESLPVFANYPEHKGLLLYCDQIEGYLTSIQGAQQNPVAGPDAVRRQAAGLARVVTLLAAQTETLDARARAALGTRVPRELATLREHARALTALADDLENELH
jgi:hypothetical protein